MKNIFQSGSFILILIGVTGAANATDAYVYSNSISAHNIATIQHQLNQVVFDTGFAPQFDTHAPTDNTIDSTQIYGRAPEYGTMSTYGEYNVFGRSGGEKQAQNNMWFDWHNTSDNVKFDNSTPIDTKINMFTAGIIGDTYIGTKTTNTWGMYAGYLHTTQGIPTFKIQSNGGYFGIYNGITMGNFAVKFALSGGVLDNSSDSPMMYEKYANFWLGGAANISYNINLDDSFAMRPALHVGYTRIKSDNYDNISNDDFNMYELSPTIDLIKHIGNGWVGTLGLRYVTIHSNGGQIEIDSQKVAELDTGDYYEYSLSLGKKIHHTQISGHIGRHDGARYGWFGGLKVKHAF